MKIVQFDPKNDNIDFIINDILKLHNEPENLKMLSFTGIEFDFDFFNKLINLSESSGINQFLLFDENDKLVGFIVTKENIMYGFELLSIAINSNYRNKGFAKMLINYSIELAKSKSYKVVNTSVFADNKKMLILLLSLDFIPIKIDYKSRYDGVDLISFQKVI